jgi:hypothetical protein
MALQLYRTLELHSHLPAHEVLRRLALHIKPSVQTLSTDSLEDESYHGEVDDNQFVMERGQQVYLGLHQVFFPVTRGAVLSYGMGSIIGLQIKLRDVMESVLAAIVVLTLAAGICVLLFSGLWFGLLIIAAVIASLGYGFYFYFCPEIDNTLEFLRTTLEIRE